MFDPYHKWLGIPRDQRPPTYYQMLGISPDEEDPEVIEEAALMRIAHVRNYQLGPHAEESSRLLRELGEASETLCDPEQRAAYDAATLPRHRTELDSRPEIEDITAAPPEPTSPSAISQPTSPRPVSAHRPEDELIQKLSNEALNDLRQPLDPQNETFWQLAYQLFQEWLEQLPPWWPTLLRRPAAVLVLVVLSVVVFRLMDWLF